MAIIYPEHLRGITTGALNEIKRKGYTTGSGGLLSSKYVKEMMKDTSEFAFRTEPLGIFMTTLEKAKTDIEITADAVSAAAKKMVLASNDATESMNDSSRKMREAVDKLGAQMQKFNNIFASAKFSEQAQAATSLADALERLAKLEERGLLEKVMTALAK